MEMVFAKNGQKIVFDDFTDETKEYGSYWVEMCPQCREKYKDILGNRADDGGTACGTCSVKGCENEADYYADFAANEVEIREEEEQTSNWTYHYPTDDFTCDACDCESTIMYTKCPSCGSIMENAMEALEKIEGEEK